VGSELLARVVNTELLVFGERTSKVRYISLGLRNVRFSKLDTVVHAVDNGNASVFRALKRVSDRREILSSSPVILPSKVREIVWNELQSGKSGLHPEVSP
jgi:hypothetical protein